LVVEIHEGSMTSTLHWSKESRYKNERKSGEIIPTQALARLEMPLLKSNSHVEERDASQSPGRRRGMFSSRTSPPPTSPQNSSTGSRRGFFGRRSSSSSNSDRESQRTNTGSTRSGGFFGRNRDRSLIQNDPTIIAARQGVNNAEAAEREADQALIQARNKVREARQHVEILEREALQDAQRAKMKQAEAKNVRQSARSLGRHG